MAFENLNQGWGGVRVSPAVNSAPTGTETAPVMRPILRKQSYLYTAGLGLNQVYTTPWVDTLQTGDLHVEVTARTSNVAANPPTYRIEGTDDIGSPNTFAVTLSYYLNGNGTNIGANTAGTLNANVTTRYWRVVFTNGSTGPATIELAITTSPVFMPNLFPAFAQQTPQAQSINSQRAPMVLSMGGSNQFYGLCVAMGLNPNANSWVDGQAGTVVAGVYSGTGAAGNAGFGVYNSVYNGSTWDRLRTVAAAQSGIIGGTSAGQTTIWNPSIGKKVRLMRYTIEAPENVQLSSAGVVGVGFAFSQGSALSSNAQNQSPMMIHPFWAPSSAGTSQGDLYSSGQIDMANGLIATAANQPLVAGLMVPQSTSAINPTWTIGSNQWEAVTIGFKTVNNTGLFKYVQGAAGSGAAATLTLSGINTLPKSLVVIVVKSVNSASGAPVFSISANSAGDVYTATAVTTNASDGANGGSLCILYVASSAGNAANSITISATNSPTALMAEYLEYQNTNGIDSALVGATGNSTSPASGNYTPATTGDLIISAMATSVNLGAAPTVDSNFFIRNQTWATSGSLMTADNFGNGALSGGVVILNVWGTEE
jgi:hypothetical protein